MWTAIQPVTHLTAAVCHIVSVVLGVFVLAAKAIIFVRHFFGDVLAGRAPPTRIRFRTVSPFTDAFQVQNVVAVLTIPGALKRLNIITAHQTLQATTVYFYNLFLSLRNINGIERLTTGRLFQIAIRDEVGMALMPIIPPGQAVVIIVPVTGRMRIGVIIVETGVLVLIGRTTDGSFRPFRITTIGTRAIANHLLLFRIPRTSPVVVAVVLLLAILVELSSIERLVAI